MGRQMTHQNWTALAENLTPEQAVDRLEALHAQAVSAQRDGLNRFFKSGETPSPLERQHFRYPELRVTY